LYLSFKKEFQTAVPRQEASNPPLVNKHRKVIFFCVLIPYRSSQKEEESWNIFEKNCRRENQQEGEEVAVG
jgi:hypothetical protein